MLIVPRMLLSLPSKTVMVWALFFLRTRPVKVCTPLSEVRNVYLPGRVAELSELADFTVRLRCYKRIHVICDNAVFHRPDRCRKMREYLKRWRHRVVLHFLPTYAPETNPIERIWWHLHEEITRNHRCPTIDDLLQLIFDWLEARKCYLIETSLYRQARAA